MQDPKDKKLKICLVSREYPPETGFGGIGTYTYNLAHGLTEMGHEVHVVCMALGEESDYKDRDVHIHRIKACRVRFLWRLRSLLPVSGRLYSFRVQEKIRELIRKYGIELVEFPNWAAEGFFYVHFSKNVPTVCRLHTPYKFIKDIEGNKYTLRDRIFCWLEKAAVRKNDKLVTSTHAHAGRMARIYNIDIAKISIIPLGLNNSLPYKEPDKNKSMLRVLFLSRAAKRKGIDTLLEAVPKVCEQYQNVEFYIVGDGAVERQREFNSRHAGKYDGRVKFIGHVSDEAKEEYLRSCDIFVVPSLSESFGLVYLEAMRYGKAVIATNIGPIKEIVDDQKTGLLVPPENVPALEKAMLELLGNAEKRALLGWNGYQKFNEQFQRDVMVSRMVDFYRQAISEHRLNNQR